MFRMCLCATLVLLSAGLMAAAVQDTKQQTKEKSGKGQEATITKVDAKNGTVTVRMKDKNGKEAERTFQLTGDIRYFDSTGKAVAIDIFQSGDDVLVVEAEGKLREMHRGSAVGAKTGDDFLKIAAQVDLTEIKMGQLAQERASSAKLKKFAEKSVEDHMKMDKELRKIAKGEALPEKLNKKHQEEIEQLSRLKGAEFDHAFVKDMVTSHEKAVKRFEMEAKNGQNPEVKAWAEKWLPTVREHLQMAREVVKDVK